jgi:hypothetical protein
MGKIFAIEFQVVNNRHNALVSVYKRERTRCYHIQLIDENLMNIFSTEHIRYKNEEYTAMDFYKDPFRREVFKRMSSAIDKVLTEQYGIIKWLFPSMERMSY